MRWLRRLWRGLASQRPIEAAIEREMQQHIEFEVESRVRAGMAPDEARRTALAQFGGFEPFKEEVRAARPRRLFDDLGRDLRLAVRQLARRRVFTVAIAATVALGVSAATTIYSLTHAVLIRPLPYATPDRLVLLWEQRQLEGSQPNVVSMNTFETWRERVRSVDDMAALVPYHATFAGTDGVERLVGLQATASYFGILGARSSLGRVLDETDITTVVISDAFWRTRLGARPDVVGSMLRLNDEAFEVVGVMPPTFEAPRFAWFTEVPAFWVPLVPDEGNRAWGRSLHVVGKLTPGATVDGLASELASIGVDLAKDPANVGWGATATTLDDAIRGAYRPSLRLLLAGVAVLLLMAVLSLAHLAAAEMSHFDHELSVRTALGATSRRLGRQLFVLLGTALAIGVAAALLLTPVEIGSLRTLLPSDVSQATIPVRWELPVATAAVMFLIVGVIAVFPALRRVRASSGALITLRSGGRASRGLRGGGFIVAHVACALIIVVAAGLMLRTMRELQRVKMGFDDNGTISAGVSLSDARASTPEATAALTAELQRRIAGLPGVQAVGAIDVRPLNGGGQATSIDRADNPPPAPGDARVSVDVRTATSSYFAAAGIPLVAGALDDFERVTSGARHAAISESLARTFWPDESPLGKRLVLHRSRSDTLIVDAVVGDVRLRGPRTESRGTAYASMYGSGGDGVQTFDLMIRATGPAAALATSVRRAVAELDPGAPIYSMRAMQDVVREASERERFTAALLSLFALAALLLASTGVFGVLMRDVVARERELGVRLALGASPVGILRQVLWRGLSRSLVGLALGTLGAIALARTMRALLFGISPVDAFSFASTATVILAITLLAVLIPGTRAARTDPQSALRSDSQ